jgi:hypothetical protein
MKSYRVPIAAILMTAASLVQTTPADAQDERVPTIPAGVPAVFLPVQATRPTAGGAWLGGMGTDRDVRDLLGAELAFAFGEEEGAESWAMPDDITARLERNPMIKVDPRRLAYHGLLNEPERNAQIYEPLHTQLRQLAALFDARIVVLPLLVWYMPPSPEEREAVAARGEEGEQAWGRAAMLTAVIDIRRSAVLWHGYIEGAPGEPTSRMLLTSLALEAARQLAPS